MRFTCTIIVTEGVQGQCLTVSNSIVEFAIVSLWLCCMIVQARPSSGRRQHRERGEEAEEDRARPRDRDVDRIRDADR